MNHLLEASKKVKWNDDLRALYKRFPAMTRSKEWQKVVSLAITGDIDQAWDIAKKAEDQNINFKVQNIISRSLRNKRIALFDLHKQAAKDLAVIFNRLGDSLSAKVEKRADSTGKVAGLSKEVDQTIKELRAELRKWLNAMLRQSTVLALKNVGDTFQPILKDMVDVGEMVNEQLSTERQLLEEPLNFATKGTKRLSGKVPLWSQKWKSVRRTIVKNIVTSSKLGIPANQRIVEISQRAANEMKRIIANNVVQGVSPVKTARDIKRFLSPGVVSAIDSGEPLGRGIYRSVFKNAMRVARTESNRAYVHASAKWAENKSFIKGVRIILSPNHNETDECDDVAAKGLMTPSEAADLVPVHPFCLCSITYEIEDRFIDKEAA